MAKHLRQSLAYLCCGLAVYKLLLFSLTTARLGGPTPIAAFVQLGFLASAISLGACAYFIFFAVRPSVEASWLVWLGFTWGVTSLSQSLYPWNLGLAVILLASGMFILPRLVDNSDSNRSERTNRFYSYIRIEFYLVVVVSTLVPFVLRDADDTLTRLFPARYPARVLLWLVSILSMAGFHMWQAVRYRRVQNIEDLKNETLVDLSVLVPFIIAVYVAANGFVLGLFFGLYLDQYMLTATSVVFFTYYSATMKRNESP